MKLKLAVITLCVLGCSAAFAQQGSATLGFEDPSGNLYCNYEQIQWNSWLMWGVENYSQCGSSTNGQIVGIKVGLPLPLPPGPDYAYADIIFDQQYPGENYLIVTQTKPSTRLRQWGWVAYLGFDGYEFLDNYGYLSKQIPGQSPSKPVLNQSNGQAAHEAAHQALRNETIQK